MHKTWHCRPKAKAGQIQAKTGQIINFLLELGTTVLAQKSIYKASNAMQCQSVCIELKIKVHMVLLALHIDFLPKPDKFKQKMLKFRHIS